MSIKSNVLDIWFPDNKNVNYTGKLIAENLGETYMEISSSNPSINVPQPAADQNIILHAKVENLQVTYVVSLSDKKVYKN